MASLKIVSFVSFSKALFIFSLIFYKPLTYDNGNYAYPSWAHIIGWTFVAASLGCIPVFAVIAICQSDGHTFFQVKFLLKRMCVQCFIFIFASISLLQKRFKIRYFY